MASPRSACRRCSVRDKPSADSRTEHRAPGVAPDAGGARVREVIVDLPAHPLDLLARRDRGELVDAPAAPARSASCASTASGVFRPCARSPAFASARATALLAMRRAAR